VIRPEKELKGFEKVELLRGEEKTVTFSLDKRAFAYYNVELKDWHVETGDFEILIGKSSMEIVLNGRIFVQSSVTIRKPVHRNTTIGDLFSNPIIAPLAKDLLAKANENNPLANADQEDGEASEMMAAMMKYMPLRALVNFSQGAFTEELLTEMIQQLNEHQENAPVSAV
jgi:beta-glucosidase